MMVVVMLQNVWVAGRQHPYSPPKRRVIIAYELLLIGLSTVTPTFLDVRV